MTGSTSSASSVVGTPAAAPAVVAPATFGDNKGIKFHIKTGNSRWACTLQDRTS